MPQGGQTIHERTSGMSRPHYTDLDRRYAMILHSIKQTFVCLSNAKSSAIVSPIFFGHLQAIIFDPQENVLFPLIFRSFDSKESTTHLIASEAHTSREISIPPEIFFFCNVLEKARFVRLNFTVSVEGGNPSRNKPIWRFIDLGTHRGGNWPLQSRKSIRVQCIRSTINPLVSSPFLHQNCLIAQLEEALVPTSSGQGCDARRFCSSFGDLRGVFRVSKEVVGLMSDFPGFSIEHPTKNA